MSLRFANEINLTEHLHNPYPTIVEQLHMVHEAKSGELVQYYIGKTTKTEGDKNTYAIGVAVLNSYGEVDYYDYVEYPDVQFNKQKSRITRQKIDRIGLKAFPNVGSIAFYKLAHRNISQILAPVNYNVEKQKYPILRAEVSENKRSVTFYFTDPVDPQTGKTSIDYNAYRVCLVLDYHQIDVITYDKEVVVSDIPMSGTYLCYVIGYIDEGEICSTLSNVLEIELKGIYTEWPTVTEGKVLTYQISRSGNEVKLLGVDNSESFASISPTELIVSVAVEAWIDNKVTIESAAIRATSIVSVLPILAVNEELVQNNIILKEANIMEVSHEEGRTTLYCVTLPTADLQMRLLIQ